jgi:hypothetical protein
VPLKLHSDVAIQQDCELRARLIAKIATKCSDDKIYDIGERDGDHAKVFNRDRRVSCHRCAQRGFGSEQFGQYARIQNANGVPFTANDPPANTFHGPPSLPPGLGGAFPPGCSVLAADKDDRNGLNGDDKKLGPGNPNCQPASP